MIQLLGHATLNPWKLHTGGEQTLQKPHYPWSQID